MTKQFDTRIFISAGLFAASMAVHAGPVSGQGTWETSLQSRDINGDGTTDAYYDTSLNMTWLADANVVGRVSFEEAMSWASALDVYGVTGWSLPTTSITGWGVGNYGTGGADWGYSPVPNSPMAHLYYVTLGNQGYPSAGSGLANTGSFSNLQNQAYWSSTLTPDPGRVWDFYFGEGALNHVHLGYTAYAWATRQGDVPVSAVPEPSSYALLLAGLGVIGLSFRRRLPAR